MGAGGGQDAGVSSRPDAPGHGDKAPVETGKTIGTTVRSAPQMSLVRRKTGVPSRNGTIRSEGPDLRARRPEATGSQDDTGSPRSSRCREGTSDAT
jgi:hypothetical protein